MTTYRAALDLTKDELEDLVYALIAYEVAETTKVELDRVTAAEKDRIAKRIRSTRIVRQQLRTAIVDAYRDGPIGTCRYAIR